MALDEFVKPQTYMGDPNQERVRNFFRQMFTAPDLAAITPAAPDFISENPLPMHDFPAILNSYSRTILFRAENGFEAMAARWGEGTLSPVHGHPMYLFYYVLEGELAFENYEKTDAGVIKIGTETCAKGEFFSIQGQAGTFDNGIHRVRAIQESLSIHIYSDNAMKGEVFKV